MPTRTTPPPRLKARACKSHYRTSLDAVTLQRLAHVGQVAETTGVRTSITAVIRRAIEIYAERIAKLNPENLPAEAIALRRAADGYSRQSPDAVSARLLDAYAKFFKAAALEIHSPESLS